MFGSIDLKTSQSVEMIEVFEDIKAFVDKSGVHYGVLTVYVPHATAGITINKNYDLEMQRDLLYALDKMVPQNGDYHHVEGNAAAHIKTSIVGNSIQLIINDGRVELGMFQSVFLCEFDGPRKRRILLKLMKDA